MNCLKSFSFISSLNENAVSPEIRTWGLAPQNYWLYRSSVGNSTFNIQGFKNVNIHKIEAVGDVSTLITASGSAAVIVNDWSFQIQVNGQNPQVSGNVTASPNRFSIVSQDIGPNFNLSRYNPSVKFASPIQSATSIQIIRLNANGIGAQNLTEINLAWSMVFNVFYSYEGE